MISYPMLYYLELSRRRREEEQRKERLGKQPVKRMNPSLSPRQQEPKKLDTKLEKRNTNEVVPREEVKLSWISEFRNWIYFSIY